jgi:hypothetical protein
VFSDNRPFISGNKTLSNFPRFTLSGERKWVCPAFGHSEKNKMWKGYLGTEDVNIEGALEEQAKAIARMGNRVFRAPQRLIRMGINDVRRYRRPMNP